MAFQSINLTPKHNIARKKVYSTVLVRYAEVYDLVFALACVTDALSDADFSAMSRLYLLESQSQLQVSISIVSHLICIKFLHSRSYKISGSNITDKYNKATSRKCCQLSQTHVLSVLACWAKPFTQRRTGQFHTPCHNVRSIAPCFPRGTPVGFPYLSKSPPPGAIFLFNRCP